MRATAPITRQDKDQRKCVSRDFRGLKGEKKRLRELCYSAGSSYLLYVLKKPLLSEKSGAKSWPDVRDTVVTDRMLFYNGCNIAAEQMISNRERFFF